MDEEKKGLFWAAFKADSGGWSEALCEEWEAQRDLQRAYYAFRAPFNAAWEKTRTAEGDTDVAEKEFRALRAAHREVYDLARATLKRGTERRFRAIVERVVSAPA